MIDWQPYLDGRVSIWCSSREEHQALKDLAEEDGVPVSSTCCDSGAAYWLANSGIAKWCHIKDWLAENNYSEIEISFHDFTNMKHFECADFVDMLMGEGSVQC